MSEQVNHPKHYNSGKIEVIEFLEDQKLEPHEWNTVKYVCRAQHKGRRIEDLEKAIWYLRRKIELLKAEAEGRAAKRPNDMTVKHATHQCRKCGSFCDSSKLLCAICTDKQKSLVTEKTEAEKVQAARCSRCALPARQFVTSTKPGADNIPFCFIHFKVWQAEEMPLIVDEKTDHRSHPDCDEPNCVYCLQRVGLPERRS